MATKKQEQSAESRRRLLDAAARLFASKGYRETTFVDIAEAAGISRGSITWHFGSKQGLLLAVVEDLVTRYDTPEATRTGNLEQLPVVLAQTEAGIRSEDGLLLVTLLLEALGPHPELRPAYAEQHQRVRDNLVEWFERNDEGGLPAQPKGLALVVLGALIGMHLQWRVDPDRVDLDAGFQALGALVERGLQPPP